MHMPGVGSSLLYELCGLPLGRNYAFGLVCRALALHEEERTGLFRQLPQLSRKQRSSGMCYA
jgi:hypothetical protein